MNIFKRNKKTWDQEYSIRSRFYPKRITIEVLSKNFDESMNISAIKNIINFDTTIENKEFLDNIVDKYSPYQEPRISTCYEKFYTFLRNINSNKIIIIDNKHVILVSNILDIRIVEEKND